MAGGFSCSGEGNLSDMEVNARLMEFGKNALADLTGLIGGAFGEEDDSLAEFLIRTLRNNIRYAHVGAQLRLKLFGLNLQTTRTDDVILAAEDSETLRREFCDIIGDERLRTDLRGMDDETALIRKTYQRVWNVRSSA